MDNIHNAGSQLDASERYRYVVVIVLAIVYSFNFLDRQLMSVLAEPIRKELNLSDTELGLLTGLAFALFYTVFGVLVAWCADRFRRVWIIAGACAVWSLFTALCGMATNFAQLAVSRMVVGIGEAGGSPPSYSLICDYFPPRERGVGLGLYSLGVPIGSMLGAAVGGAIAAQYGWRTAFIAVGLPGLAAALAILLFIREPRRGALDQLTAGAVEHDPAPPFMAAVTGFFGNPILVLVALSSGLSAFVSYGMLNWNVPFLIRVKGMDLKQVAAYYSLILGVTGIIGTFGAGWLVDRLGQKDRRWYAWVPAISFALSLPGIVGLLWAPTWHIALLFVTIPSLLNTMYLAPALSVVQNAVAPARRTMAGAIFLLVLNLIGLGGGPVYVGMISDRAREHYGDHSLVIGYAALIPVLLLTIATHLAVSVLIARDENNRRALAINQAKPLPRHPRQLARPKAH
jgi:MFS family permease